MAIGFKANRLWETAVVLTTLFYMLPIMAFKCELLLSYSNSESQLGNFLAYLCNNHHVAIRNIFFILILLHFTEAILAGMLCAHMECDANVTLQWTFNVFIHGVLSFRHLLTILFEYESQKQEPLTQEMKFGLADLAR